MKLIILSDTHGKPLPPRLLAECEDADLIIHAGDWAKTREASSALREQLAAYAEVIGVAGNIDETGSFPAKQIVQAGRFTLGIVHGHGDKGTTEKRAVDAFASEDVDAIIFGHSHIPLIKYTGRTLLLNPGSPTDKRRLPHFSFIILTIKEEMQVELVLF